MPPKDDLKGFEVKALNRRELMKRTLQVSAAAYVAPMILASETPASAQISATCIGATCVSFIPCQNNPNCVCFSLANGQGFCGIGVSCAGLASCSLASPCAAGFVCQVFTCCGDTGICVSDQTACAIAGSNPPTFVGPGTSRSG
jgi:hypothetical protein